MFDFALLRAIRHLDIVPIVQVEKVKKAVETAKQLRSDLHLEGECEAGCRIAMASSAKTHVRMVRRLAQAHAPCASLSAHAICCQILRQPFGLELKQK